MTVFPRFFFKPYFSFHGREDSIFRVFLILFVPSLLLMEAAQNISAPTIIGARIDVFRSGVLMDDESQDFEIVYAARKPYTPPKPAFVESDNAFVQSGADKLEKVVPESVSDEDIYLDVAQIIEKYGYKVKAHNVETEDGFILTLFRITGNVNKKSGGKASISGPAVFLQHGFMGSAADWIMIDKESVLPYQLSDNGFDVWLGNARGNKYSTKHTKYSRLDPRYWKFSFQEMGQYDLKAAISYIRNLRFKENGKCEKINYIGHSMGTTMFFVFLSLNPSMNDYIETAVSLAPAGYMNSTRSPARALTALVPLYKILRVEAPIAPKEITDVIRLALPHICGLDLGVWNPCENMIAFMIGGNPADYNQTVIERVLGHLPVTISLRTLIHFVQQITLGDFRQFDYGNPIENFAHYGQKTPPAYDLSKITVNTINIFGLKDTLVDDRDARRTIAAFGTSPFKYNYEIFSYNHIDLIWGDSTATAVNSYLLKFFMEFYGKDKEVKPSGLPILGKATQCAKTTPTENIKNLLTGSSPGKNKFWNLLPF